MWFFSAIGNEFLRCDRKILGYIDFMTTWHTSPELLTKNHMSNISNVPVENNFEHSNHFSCHVIVLNAYLLDFANCHHGQHVLWNCLSKMLGIKKKSSKCNRVDFVMFKFLCSITGLNIMPEFKDNLLTGCRDWSRRRIFALLGPLCRMEQSLWWMDSKRASCQCVGERWCHQTTESPQVTYQQSKG